MPEYIEREAALSKPEILTIHTNEFGKIDVVPVEYIADLPAANVELVVHGKWMGWTTSAYIGLDDVGDPKYANRIHFRCSKCRYGTVVKSAYCPSCGAKMEVANRNG